MYSRRCGIYAAGAGKRFHTMPDTGAVQGAAAQYYYIVLLTGKQVKIMYTAAMRRKGAEYEKA